MFQARSTVNPLPSISSLAAGFCLEKIFSSRRIDISLRIDQVQTSNCIYRLVRSPPTLDPPQKLQSQPLVAQLDAAFPLIMSSPQRYFIMYGTNLFGGLLQAIPILNKHFDGWLKTLAAQLSLGPLLERQPSYSLI